MAGPPMGPSLPGPALLLALVVVTAGCLSAPAGLGPRVDEGPQGNVAILADYQGCPSETYADGTTVPCNGTAVEGTWHATVPPGWVCTVGDGGFGIYRNLASAEEQYGAAYSVPAEAAPVGGVASVRSDAGTFLYHWPLNDHVGTVGDYAEGFVEFPPDPWGLLDVTFQAFVYHSHFETDTPALQAARIEQVWSLEEMEGDAFPEHHLMQRLTTSSGTYTFPVGTARPFSGLSRGFAGEDFAVHFEVNPWVGFPPQDMGIAAAWPFCPIPT